MVGAAGLAGVAPASSSALARARGTYFADAPSKIRGPPQLHLPLLTLGAFGFQLVWSMEMAFAGPFLTELGLSKSQVAAVLVAGPISGLIVQPIIGVLADSSTHPWGRRRPPLLIACCLSAASMFLLGFARDVAALIAKRDGPSHRWFSQLAAILAVFGVDFSVNAVMSLDRALYVDMLPPSQQGSVSAWAARLAGLGDVLGFLVSHASLPDHAPFSWYPSLKELTQAGLNEGQLKCLCFITSFFLLATHAVTCWAAQERRLISSEEQRRITVGELYRTLKELVQDFTETARNLSSPVKWVFAVQFFSWIGWFPILFFSTMWVGAIWSDGNPSADPVSATQHGALALYYRAVLALIVSIAAPYFVLGAESEGDRMLPARALSGRKVEMASLWAASTFLSAGLMFSTLFAELFSSATIATVILGATGFCWAIISWIPFSLVGILISNDRSRGSNGETMHAESRFAPGAAMFDAGNDAEQEAFLSEEERPGIEEGDYASNEGGRLHDKAGTILGLLNCAIVLPQFISSAISSLLFAIKDAAHTDAGASPAAMALRSGTMTGNTAHDASSIGFVFRFGAVSAVVAGFLARILAKRYREDLIAR